MTWRRYDPQHSVACRTPTRPIGWPVCPLAPDAAAPVRTDSSILMGSGCRVGRGLAALPRGPTVAAPRGRPEKTDREASRRAPGVALAVPGLCRSALRPGLAPDSRRDPDRAVPPRWHPAVHPHPGVTPVARRGRARLCGGPLMLQLTPQSRIFLSTEAVDFRKGIDGLAAVCRQVLGDNPLAGPGRVVANRPGAGLKLLLSAGQGGWLWLERILRRP